MKTIFPIAIVLLMYSCNYNSGNKNLSEKSPEINSKDTIFDDDVADEMRENSEKHRPLEKIKLFDKNNRKLLSYSKDTINLEIVYKSEKFPKLNNSHVIHIETVSNNMKLLKRLNANKFSLFIEPDTEPFVFDVYLSSTDNVFKRSYIYADKKIAHEVVPMIFLFRKTLPAAIKNAAN